MRDFNSRGLSLELRLLLLLLLLLAPLCQPSVGKTTATSATDDLPHPWLTENRTAKILELLCRPPANIKWDKIYDLKLRFSRLVKVVTLASVTTATGIPHREKVPDIARVSFNGNWNSPSLSVLMPFTSEDFGEYSCSGQYKEQGSTGGTAFPYFNTNIIVNGSQSQPRNKRNFEVRVTDAHEVRVTWSPPNESKLIQASVSSTLVDKDGKDIAAGRSLVTTNGSKTFVYTSRVLLEEFRKPNGDVGNFSVRLYVDSALCHPYCRYSCHVPYTGCYGRDAQFCVCSQEGVSHNQDPVPESSQSTDLESTTECQGQDPVPESTEFTPAFIAVLALFIASVVVWVILGVLCYLFKRQKCQNCEGLVRFVACLAKNVNSAEQMNRSPSAGVGKKSEVSLNGPNSLGNSSSHDHSEPGTSGTGNTNPSVAQDITVSLNKVNKATACPGSGLPSGTDNEKDPMLTPGHSQSSVQDRPPLFLEPFKVQCRYQHELT